MCSRGQVSPQPLPSMSTCCRTMSNPMPRAPFSACTTKPPTAAHGRGTRRRSSRTKTCRSSGSWSPTTAATAPAAAARRRGAYPRSMPKGTPSSCCSSPAGARRTGARGRHPHRRAADEAACSTPRRPTARTVEAIGKNLLLRFEGGLILRSHLRMKGRWLVLAVTRRSSAALARPARRRVRRCDVQRCRPRAQSRIARRLGPDILAEPPRLSTRCGSDSRRESAATSRRRVLDERLVAGIGNLWKRIPFGRARLPVAPPRRSHRRRAPRDTRSSARA